MFFFKEFTGDTLKHTNETKMIGPNKQLRLIGSQSKLKGVAYNCILQTNVEF